jgi:hypothetical protein
MSDVIDPVLFDCERFAECENDQCAALLATLVRARDVLTPPDARHRGMLAALGGDCPYCGNPFDQTTVASDWWREGFQSVYGSLHGDHMDCNPCDACAETMEEERIAGGGS